MSAYTEDSLVQQTTAAYMEEALGWTSVLAFNNEDFGPDSLLGRSSDREVVLVRSLQTKLAELNPGLPASAYEDAVRQMAAAPAIQSPAATNREKYALIRDGVPVTFRNDKGERVRQRLQVMDFQESGNNEFLCVRELWVQGDLYRRRADIVGFVNGLPLLFMELKNVHRDIRAAYEQNFADYKDTVPHLFHHNAMVVLANGVDAKIGSMTSHFGHFHEWKRLAEEEPGAVDMETLLKGVCDKNNFMDLVENFIVFDESAGEPRKILARNHQFLGVNRAVAAVLHRKQRDGRLGVFWHTQGAGKSYSMVLFTRKVHRRLGGNFTFLVLTDREDLDNQIYRTFAGCGVVDNDREPCRAASGQDLARLLTQQKSHIFSLIQKFNQEISPDQPYTLRDDIIIVTDEAHRTQYGTLALNMRNALPNAACIGFTGTPLFTDDEITRRVFGNYLSTYDFQRAVADNATVPLYYDARGDKLGVAVGDLNVRIAEKLAELETDDIDVTQRLQQELGRDYHVLTAGSRLDQVARDFVRHYAMSWETGKAMLVCIDKITCVRMYKLIAFYWDEQIREMEKSLPRAADDQEEMYRQRQIQWMRETRMAVVVSEEQGEVEKFRQWDLDIITHRRLIKEGMNLPASMREQPRYANMQRLALEDAFKNATHPFRVAIVCAMWLTGFDVPCLSTLYLDKPLKAHTLMQAIARANRISKGKNNGMIVDYCGILKNLRKALATFAGAADGGRGTGYVDTDPARPDRDLLEDLAESIALVRSFLMENGASLDKIVSQAGFQRNAAILAAKEAANDTDETRKRFEVMCRMVFTRFKACLPVEGVARYRSDYDAINIVYKSLQQDRSQADITGIIRQLHQVVYEAIEIREAGVDEHRSPYDISNIDFDRLRQEFARSPAKRTTIQNLKTVIEKRLQRMLQQNPSRMDFQLRYEEMVAAYNREKDRVTIEETFDELMQINKEMGEEKNRAMREGLDEESLALFDLLRKPELTPEEIRRIKAVAVDLLKAIKARISRIDHWTTREATRDAVRLTIQDLLWEETTGLPVKHYTNHDVKIRTEEVFRHVYRVYPVLPSPFYESRTAA